MKIGDKVRVIKHTDPVDAVYYEVGDTGVVVHIESDGDSHEERYYKVGPVARVDFDDDFDDGWWVPVVDLEIITEESEQ